MKFKASLIAICFLAACTSKEDKAKEHYDNALTYLEKNEFSKARIEFKNATKNNPKLAAAYFELAKLAKKDDNIKAYYENLLLAEKLDDSNLEAKKLLVEIYLLNRKYDEALLKIDDLVAANYSEDEIARMKATALIGTKKLDQARVILAEKLKTSPRDSGLLSLMAAVEDGSGNGKQAVLLLEKAVQYANQEDKVGYLLVSLAINQKLRDIDKTEENLIALYKLNKDEQSYTLMLSQFVFNIGKKEEAENYLRSFTQKFPENMAVQRALVEVVDARDKRLAGNILQDLIAKYPKEYSLKLYKIERTIRSNKLDESINLLETFIANPDNPQAEKLNARSLLAEIKYSKGEKDEAVRLADENLLINPDHAKSHLVKARYFLQEARFDDAINALRNTLRIEPESEQALVLIGNAYAASGSEHLADDSYRQALKLNPYDLDAAIPVVRTMLKNNNIQRAEEIVIDVITRYPEDARLNMFLAQIKVMKNDWSGSDKILKRLRDKGVSSPYLEYLSGRIFFGQKDYLSAIEKYHVALEKDFKLIPALKGLGAAYEKITQPKKFIKYLDQYQMDHPEILNAYAMSSSVYNTIEDVESGRGELSQGLKFEPKWELGWLLLANSYISVDDYANGVNIYLEALKALPESKRINLSLALAYEHEGQYRRAVNVYQNLLKHHPDDIVSLNNYAILLVDKLGDAASLEKAKELIVMLESFDQAGILDTVGWVKVKTGDVMGGEALLRKASEDANQNAEILYHHAYALIQMDRSQEAKQLLRRARSVTNKSDTVAQLIDQALANIE